MHSSGSINPLESNGSPDARLNNNAPISVDVGVILSNTAANSEPTANDLATRTITSVNSGEQLAPTYDMNSLSKQDTIEDYRPKPQRVKKQPKKKE